MREPVHGRRRNSNRAGGYDYSTPGWYFVTVCTYKLRPMFGEVVEGQMVTNSLGEIVEETWHNLPDRFDHIDLDAFVLMPNHIHGIIGINETPETADALHENLIKEQQEHPVQAQGTDHVRARFIAPSPRRGPTHDASNAAALTGKGAINRARTSPRALGNIVRVFKAVATDRIRRSGTTDFRWHRNYYDHIIRDERDLDRVRDYIAGNPGTWPFDRANRKETTHA